MSSPKPTLTLRKPPSAADAFVAAAEAPRSDVAPAFTSLAPVEIPQAPKAPGSQVARRPGKGIVTRASGRTARRMTMYIHPELARRIIRLCADTEREISDVAAEALERYLAANALPEL